MSRLGIVRETGQHACNEWCMLQAAWMPIGSFPSYGMHAGAHDDARHMQGAAPIARACHDPLLHADLHACVGNISVACFTSTSFNCSPEATRPPNAPQPFVLIVQGPAGSPAAASGPQLPHPLPASCPAQAATAQSMWPAVCTAGLAPIHL